MKILYAPWRQSYAKNISESDQGKETTQKDDCIFCSIIGTHQSDDKNFVLKRYEYHLIILNKFPYNAGHILIIPYTHTRDLNKLNKQEQQELISLISQTTLHVEKALLCEGINVGINMGKAAGAGIPAHLHIHVLPRWQGDTNFLPTLTQTKALSFDLKELYTKLLPYFS